MLNHWQNLYVLRDKQRPSDCEAQSHGTDQQSKNPPYVFPLTNFLLFTAMGTAY
jgi:hypothetical protein